MADEPLKNDDVERVRHYSIPEYVNIVCMIALIVFVFLQVIVRYVLKQGGLSWTGEISRIIFTWMAFLGLGAVTKYDAHFKLELNFHFKKWLVLGQKIVIFMAQLAVMILFVYQGYKLSRLTQSDITPALMWPVSVFYLPLPLGALGVIFYLFRNLVLDIKGR